MSVIFAILHHRFYSAETNQKKTGCTTTFWNYLIATLESQVPCISIHAPCTGKPLSKLQCNELPSEGTELAITFVQFHLSIFTAVL